MKLRTSFFRLPLTFDAARLAREVAQFAEQEWRVHPQGHRGNSALPLIAAGGDPTNEQTRGEMLPTPYLEQCPYLKQVLASLGAPMGRTRLMRIEGRGEATAHVDTNYYWSQRVRVHIPILTYPGVRFLCGADEVFMDAGECWIFDTWQSHNVLNPDDRPRIHLVADTVGSPSFWELVARAECPFDPAAPGAEPAQFLPYVPGQAPVLETERCNFPVVMSPWEARFLINTICQDLVPPAGESSATAPLQAQLERFLQQWQALWARFGERSEGWPRYEAALQELDRALTSWRGRFTLSNNVDPVRAIQHWVILAALNPDQARPASKSSSRREEVPAPTPATVPPTPVAPHSDARLDRPLFIVSAPRSGSTLLFETLARAANVYTIGGESHQVFESIPELAPAASGFASSRVTAEAATPTVLAQLRAAFASRLINRAGEPPAPGQVVRMLEKTPKNALRIPFLAAAFPDARFIYLYREPHENLASIIEAWQSGRFVTYPQLPGWEGPPWSLLLTPGWQVLRGRELAEIAATQWNEANRQIMDDLSALPADRWCTVTYQALLDQPQTEIERLCRFAGFEWDQLLSEPLPLSRHTLTPPDPEKWKRQAARIEPVLPRVAETARRARELCDATLPVAAERATRAANGQPAAGNGSVNGSQPLGSVHTQNFPRLLQELGISLMVSTYQAGKLVMLRARGERLNTHFRNFNKPMGLALQNGRLAIGTELELREFQDVPMVARKLEPAGSHDAAFLPRTVHTTGDILVHELAWTGDELWFVNTRFSALCSQDPAYSFVPRWRPRFVSALAPEDRCHLNGLAVVDGQPRYVTALAESDLPKGWRDHKKDGGILIDVLSDEIVTRGLSMPHSPRWYAGRLWVLNSGEGGIGVIDPQSGHYEEVARVPGFTRGLDFHGRYAFIGLSQVRESAIFSGIAIAELPVEERRCGVWVLDIVTGQTVAFVRFEDAVQEIFSVLVAPGIRFPDLIQEKRNLISNSFILPDEAITSVPVAARS